MAVITLLTDFGLRDAYVGIMKGVILTRAPHARVVDITHQIPPQDLTRAANLVDSAYAYFPKGSIHMVVVDPGVGSARPIIALAANDHFFLAPDNGVLTKILDNAAITAAVRVENPHFFLANISRTFHGRDIFAPVAAHLLNGVSLPQLGPAVAPEICTRLPFPAAVLSPSGDISGALIDMDRFGNLITNIDEALLKSAFGSVPLRELTIRLEHNEIKGLSSAYADVPPGAPLAIVGSRGLLEVSINGGSAKEHFSAQIGATVQVRRHGSNNGEIPPVFPPLR